MLVAVYPQTCAADAAAFVLDGPGVGVRLASQEPGGHLVSEVVAATVPLPPPRRAVCVLFLRIDWLAHAGCESPASRSPGRLTSSAREL